MQCNHCCAENEELRVDCAYCGTPLRADAPEEGAAAPDEIPYTAQPERRAGFLVRSWKLLAPAALVVLVGIVAVVFWLNPSPNVLAGRALAGLVNEAGTRLAGTPFAALAKLADGMDSGRIAVNAAYSDADGFSADIDVLLSYDTVNVGFSAEGRAAFLGKEIDADLYFNKDRLAFHTSLLGEEYYGLRYETCREELTAFCDLMGVDSAELDERIRLLEELVEPLETAGDTREQEAYDFRPYEELMRDFLAGVNPTASSVKTELGGKSVTCTAVEYRVTGETLIPFLREFCALLRDDERIRAQYELSRATGAYDAYVEGERYDAFIQTMQDAIDELEAEFDGALTVTLLIDGSGRLVNLSVTWAEAVAGEERESATVALDLGASVYDTWVLSVSGPGVSSGELVSWTYQETADTFRNTLEVMSGATELALTSVWSRADGAFALSYDTGREAAGVTGVLTLAEDGGFDLLFDEISDGDGTVVIGVSLQSGAEIADPAYLSIGALDDSFLNKLTDAVVYLIG